MSPAPCPKDSTRLGGVDVDLMRPVARALEEVFPRMAPGGTVVVDDCTPGLKYDGAGAAYLDFVQRIGAAVDSRYEKLGLIRVPAHAEVS